MNSLEMKIETEEIKKRKWDKPVLISLNVDQTLNGNDVGSESTSSASGS